MALRKPIAISSYAAICSASWTGAMFLWTTPLLVPAVQKACGLSLIAAGSMVTALLTAGGVGLLVANLFVRRVSLHLIAIAGGAIVISGCAILGLGGWGLSLAALAAFIGLGNGLIMSVVDPAAARLATPERALSFAGVTNTIIAALAFALIPLAMQIGGAKWIFWSHALMAAAFLPVLLLALPKARFARAVRPDVVPPGKRRLPIAIVLCAHVLYSLGMGSYWAFLEQAGYGAGLSATATGAITSLATILSLAAPIAATWMGAQFGRAAPLALGTAAFAVSAALTLVAKTPAAFTLYLTIASAGIVFIPGFLGGVLIALDQTGRAANLASAAGFLLNGAGPGLGALITARFGLGGLAIGALVLCLGSAALHVWPALLVDRFSRAPRLRKGALGLEITHGVATPIEEYGTV